MKNFFTDDFYKFLLGFSAIILVSFGVLLFLGFQVDGDGVEEVVEPTSQTAN